MAGAVTWLPAGEDVQAMVRKVIDECYPGTFAAQEVVAVFRDDPKWKNAGQFHPVPKWARLLTLPPDQIEEARQQTRDRMVAALEELEAASAEAKRKLQGDQGDDSTEEAEGEDDDGPELNLGVCFVIELRLDWWASQDDEMREALIDHELHHRVKREHDIVEFIEVAARRPCLKRSIDTRVESKVRQLAFEFGQLGDEEAA